MAEQYVINPDTGRLIRRGGATHRRWKRCHLDAPVLEPVPLHMLTPRLQQRVLNIPPPLVRYPTPVLRADRPHYPTATRSAAFASEFPTWPQRFVSQPFMSNNNAYSCGDLDSKMDDPEGVNERTPLVDENADMLVDEVLTHHGPQLLDAYQNPDVDFMDTLAEAFGMNSAPEKKG